MKIFLGGTVGSIDWRKPLMKLFDKYGIDYFDPVLPEGEDWTEESRINEETQKKTCNIHLYVITPEMKGIYSIAEIVQSSNDRYNDTIVCFLDNYHGLNFSEHQHNNFVAISTLLINNPNTYIFFNLKDTINKIFENF